MNRNLAVFGTLVLSLGVGWGAGRSASPVSDAGGSRSPASIGREGTVKDFVKSLGAMGRWSTHDKFAALELKADGLQLTPAEKNFAAAVGDSPLSRKIRRMILAGFHPEQMSESGQLGIEYLAEFQTEPAASADAITKALGLKEMTDPSLYAGRAALLVSLSQLPGQQAQAAQLAAQELVNHPIEARPDFAAATTEEQVGQALSSTPQMALPLIAHSIVLAAATDATSAMSQTVDGIVAQPDLGVRNMLGRQFVEKFPDSEIALRTALKGQGITLAANLAPDPQQLAQGNSTLLPPLTSQGGGQ